MFTIIDYGTMIADRARINAYAGALQSAVKPDSVVLEVGTGTGFFAILACRYGARKVYAIEPNDAIEVAKELARENGCADKIIFIQDLAKNVTLPEKASVIISDMRGILPVFRHHLPGIIDIRERMLERGGMMIPARDSLWATLVSTPTTYQELVGPWQETNHQVNMHSVSRLVTNNFIPLRVLNSDEHNLVKTQCWANLDYYTINDANVSGNLSWQVEQDDRAHGIKVWFDTELTEKIGFSNADTYPGKIYGSYFFPWPREVLLHRGYEISISLKANLIDEDYVWCWNTRIRSGKGSSVNETVFEQSTFKGTPLSLTHIRKRSENFRPVLKKIGLIDKQILHMMEAEAPLKDIAQTIFERFPEHFTDYQQSLNYAGKLSLQYSK